MSCFTPAGVGTASVALAAFSVVAFTCSICGGFASRVACACVDSSAPAAGGASSWSVRCVHMWLWHIYAASVASSANCPRRVAAVTSTARKRPGRRIVRGCKGVDWSWDFHHNPIPSHRLKWLVTSAKGDSRTVSCSISMSSGFTSSRRTSSARHAAGAFTAKRRSTSTLGRST